tara:strand:+ start:30613 stop:31488 length:876 start_codon:yes stop_codon:yes gene_type:complete
VDYLGYDIDKILITGSQGFLGKEIVKKSKKLDPRHVRFVFTGLRNLENVFKCDLTFLADVNKLSEKVSPSLIIHCASYVPKNLTEYNDINASKKNCTMMKNLVSVFTCPILFISSMAIYGEKSGKPIDEKEALEPSSAYGLGKKNAEGILLKSNNPSLSVRIPGLYGFRRESGLVYNLINSMLNDTKIKLPQSPLLWAAMDVEDAAKIILELCFLDWSNIDAVNVSYDEKYSINRLVDILNIKLNKEIDCNVNHPTFEYNLNLIKQMGVGMNFSFDNSLEKLINNLSSIDN